VATAIRTETNVDAGHRDHTIRYERYPEIHTALLVLACSILCWRRLKSL
jgi:hypothetical protein